VETLDTRSETMRKKTDQELKEILKRLNKSERHGLVFGLLPADKIPTGELSPEDVARLIELRRLENLEADSVKPADQ